MVEAPRHDAADLSAVFCRMVVGPMPRLAPCSSCKSHHRVDESNCPHCGALVRTTGHLAVPAIVLGLALAGCPRVEPAYGVPVTPDPGGGAMTTTPGDDGSTTLDDGGASDVGDSAGTGDTPIEPAEPQPAPEPEYGVPETH